VKHLALFAIATANTDSPQPPIVARPRRERKHFRAPAWLRPFKAPRLDSREALT
jgi:hypothetical protein